MSAPTLPCLTRVSFTLSLADLDVTAVSGSNVSLCVSNLPSIYKQLTWFNTTKQKLLEWEPGKVKYFDTKSRNRITFDPQSSALNISDVREEDSNTYLVRILKEGGTEHEWRLHLRVLGEWGSPKPSLHSKGLGWTPGGGRFPASHKHTCGRQRGTQFTSFHLDSVLLGSEPRSVDPQTDSFPHLIPHLKLLSLRSEEKENKTDHILWVSLVPSCDEPKFVLRSS